jgi:hypothetical protein
MLKDRQAAAAAGKAGAVDIRHKEQEDQFDAKMLERIGKAVNVLSTGSKLVVTLAAKANMQSDRAMQVLINPKATNEDIQGLAVTDIAALMKGGVPDKELIKSNTYNSLSKKFSDVMTFITATPQAANTPAIRQKLIEVVKGLKQIDNKIIQDNLGIEAVVYEPFIKRHPDTWQRLTEAVGKTTQGLSDVPPSVQRQQLVPAKQHPQAKKMEEWAKNNPNDPRSKEILKRLGVQ